MLSTFLKVTKAKYVPLGQVINQFKLLQVNGVSEEADNQKIDAVSSEEQEEISQEETS